MTYLGRSTNEYGTPVSRHRCDDCGDEFTVCPESPNFGGCLAEGCPSYDISRDIDRVWDGVQKFVVAAAPPDARTNEEK